MTVTDNWNFTKSNTRGRLGVGFGIALLLLAANAWVSFRSVVHLQQAETWVAHTAEILREIETDISLAKDVETGTRGYVITANPDFLDPYNAAKIKVQNKLEPLFTMTADNPPQQKRVLELARLIDRKLRASKRQIDLVDAGKKREAELLVASGEGKAAMDDIRTHAGKMRAEEERLLNIRREGLRQAGRNSKITVGLAALFGLWLMALIYNGLVKAKLQSQELQVALVELKRLEAMRDSLNAMLVHDLRTPLTTILGPLEMLQSEEFGSLDSMQKEIVGMSLMSSQRLLGLINELLDVTKMEAGEMKLRRQSLQPQFVIDEAVKHVALAQYGGTAPIEQKLPEELPLLQADQELLTRVLINLLGNAMKFTPSSGKITLGLNRCIPLDVLPPRLKPAPNAKGIENLQLPSLLFCVTDTGEGIPPEDIDRIFEKFGQVETREAGRKMSSGLGLTFCKLAVEAHGGVIWVESEVGKGSTFYFTVPLRSVEPDTEAKLDGEAAAAVS